VAGTFKSTYETSKSVKSSESFMITSDSQLLKKDSDPESLSVGSLSFLSLLFCSYFVLCFVVFLML
jgi:hypothetical protein